MSASCPIYSSIIRIFTACRVDSGQIGTVVPISLLDRAHPVGGGKDDEGVEPVAVAGGPA